MRRHLFFTLFLSFALFSENNVEQQFLAKSKRKLCYQSEKVPIIEVQNIMELGKITALKFIEWVIENPHGVIALPTGKSPEFFIKFLSYYKEHWSDPDITQELEKYGINNPSFPDTQNLKFVQLDEFYPSDPFHEHSFYNYIHRYYLPLLNLKPENMLLMDPAHIINVESFCDAYEQKINEWGGIGFFLGGIGTDGHIAFNVRGSSYNSKTRLIMLNYESACAIAPSLGGMEYARNKTAVTIGLDTITRNKDATIIIIAAGEEKAPIIAHAIEHQDIHCPAAILQNHPGARYYLTKGAASHLHDRNLDDIQHIKDLVHETQKIDQILAHCAVQLKKPIHTLTKQDLDKTQEGAIASSQIANIPACTAAAAQRFSKKITCVLPHNKSILHTSPHHDDVMLSYHPVAIGLLSSNKNHVAYVTSGFNAVTNEYIKDITKGLTRIFVPQQAPLIFSDSYNELLKRYITAFAQDNQLAMEMIEQIIAAQQIAKIYRCQSIDDLVNRVEWIHQAYMTTVRPGEKDNPSMQVFKGAMRESECDRMWAIHGLSVDHITHLRSRFYTGEYFTPKPTFDYDVEPLLQLFNKCKPDIITVAFDPEGTGPDTHYKVLQMVAEAVRAWQKNGTHLEIWGYRNVWHRFAPQDATMMVPVSHAELDHLHTVFMNCFSTQKDAPFPSHIFDGPFSRVSVDIQKEQLKIMRTLLGDEFFDVHPDERVRTAAGLCFIKAMSSKEFLEQAQKLREYTELINE